MIETATKSTASQGKITKEKESTNNTSSNIKNSYVLKQVKIKKELKKKKHKYIYLLAKYIDFSAKNYTLCYPDNKVRQTKRAMGS